MKRLILISIIFGQLGSVFPQDPIISAFTSSPLSINPATTGTFQNEKLRIYTGIDRDHHPLEKSSDGFTTINFAVDISLLKGRLGIGNVFYYDKNPIIKAACELLSLSYKINIFRTYKLNVGIQGGVFYKQLDWDKLTFGDPVSERFGFIYNTQEQRPSNSDLTKYYPDFNFGTMLFKQSDTSVFNPWIGFSIFHIFEPEEGFISLSRLPRKWTAYAGADIAINNQLYATTVLYYSQQRQFGDIAVSEVFNFHKKHFSFKIGGSIRVLTHQLHLQLKDQLQIQYSTLIGGGYGGFELLFDFLTIRSYNNNIYFLSPSHLTLRYKLKSKAKTKY